MNETVILYGIPNCDTVKKASAWLDTHVVDYMFHDYKKHGIDPARLNVWIDRLGWEALLNRSGTTFRKLSDPAKADLDRYSAAELMVESPSMIRRPVIEAGDALIVGFDLARFEAQFG